MTVLRTFANVSIKSGVTTSQAVVLPAGLNSLDVSMSRENWPAVGADVSLLASFDGGTTYQTVAGPVHIAPFVATPKQTTPTPAAIGFSWSGTPPTHAKGVINSTQSQAFTSTISLIGG